jgi:hypothetical protein
MGLTMSKAQLENLVTENVKRMDDDHDLNEWLPGVAANVRGVEVGVWRCPSGETTCVEGCCGGDGCECCDNAGLWESPLDWEPECRCGRKAFLVEVVGCFDYSAALA